MKIRPSLDAEVTARLARLRRARKVPADVLINEALRLGLRRMLAGPARRRRYRTRTVNLGRCLLDNLDCTHDVLTRLEGDRYR